MSVTAGVHQSAGYNDPTSNYLLLIHLMGLTREYGTVDDRHPLSQDQLTQLIKAQRHIVVLASMKQVSYLFYYQLYI